MTYSRSVTLVLTHDCPWHCGYCGFRSDGEGLVSEEEIERVVEEARAGTGISGNLRRRLRIGVGRRGFFPMETLGG